MVVFLLMMMMSASHVLLKVVACSLMLRISQLWFLSYLLGDMSLFFIYKTVRGEMRYALRVSGVFSWIVSFLMRSSVKNITDL